MILTDTCIFALYSLLFSPTNTSFAGVTELDRYRQEFNPGYNYMSYYAVLLIQMMLAHNLVPKERSPNKP